MKPVPALLALCAVSTLALPATTAETAAARANTCFRTSEMHNHSVLDSHTLLVAVGVRDVWRIGMSGNCLAGAFPSDPLILRTTASTGMVCDKLDLDIAIKQGGPGGIASHCIVDSVTKLTPAEIAAVPKKLRP